jgi:hypothetical protein
MPPLADHETERRRHVMAAIQARRDLRLAEVRSDFRGIWDNGFTGSLGYRLSVNELTDTFLYMSSLLAAGAGSGTTRLFLASETEVQDNAVLDGKIVQHSHFMYSAATQRALARLLAPYGIEFGSLTWPLYTMQVQQLLWARYPDLCDLQYSCWRVEPGQATCSQCEDCLRFAVTALASGDNPERMGIELRKVLAHALRWAPPATGSRAPPALPQDFAVERLEAQVMAAVRRISLPHLAGVLARGSTWRLLSPATLKAWWRFARLRNCARRASEPPSQGVREAFFDWLDPQLRPSLIAIYTHHFPREPRSCHLGIFERSNDLTRRATSALD